MIDKKATIESNFKNKLYFFDSAREAWGQILNSLPNGSRVLLPNYIGISEREGSGIYDPIIENKIKHEFYTLNKDLSISTKKIEEKLASNKYDLILIVNYFGFISSEINKSIELCKKHNLLIVEDCAHLYNYNLPQYDGYREKVDFTFYSLHKYFPFENGGMLWQRNNSINFRFKINKDIESYAFKILSYDTYSIAQKRRANFLRYEKLLKNIDGISFFKSLGKHDIPHNFPIIIENGLREKLYFWMIDKGIHLIALYYKMIPPLDNVNNIDALMLSKNILNLPLYQDIEEKDIKLIVKLLKKGLLEIK